MSTPTADRDALIKKCMDLANEADELGDIELASGLLMLLRGRDLPRLTKKCLLNAGSLLLDGVLCMDGGGDRRYLEPRRHKPKTKES
jgi:hypothetical protein